MIMKERKRVRFEDLKYDLTGLFKQPPQYDVPPLRFDLPADPNASSWNEVYELLLGETRASKFAYEYLKVMRDRNLLSDLDPD